MEINTINNRTRFLKSIVFGLITFLIFSCDQDPSKKINAENVKAVEERIDKAYDSAEIEFEFDSYDFGEVKDGEIVEVDFNFTNSGKSDLIIFDASASCGCTVPEYPQNVNIKPGQSDKLKVRFDTANKPGKQIKSVTLTTNTNSGKKIIRISGFVLNK
ncbi:MAG: hypothetical protein CMC64_00020 [Flavobacteriaceae bacterium]|jgi:hypothetical protein|nr:hypothetical protein [Flavobacteriaceae bacterium]|tara:strand:- start:380 stop:856 length:477 start_codon:yes stop_codon:yes gene_type:complete